MDSVVASEAIDLGSIPSARTRFLSEAEKNLSRRSPARQDEGGAPLSHESTTLMDQLWVGFEMDSKNVTL